MAQAFITQAQNTLAVQQTEPQCQALKEWTYPDWFTPAPRKGKARMVPKKSEHPLATLSGPSADSPTDLTATPAVPRVPPLHADSWQPRHPEDVRLNMPTLWDPPKMWAMWIDQNPDHCLRGIVVMPDGRVSMCSIRVMQLIKRCNPRREAVEQH
jgi:hypothetical protein